MRYAIRLVCLALLGAGATSCAEDKVYPGYYGQPATREQSIEKTPSEPAGSGGLGGAAGTAPQTHAGAGAAAGESGSAGSAGTAGGGASGMNAEGGAPAPTEPLAGACDLSGRWLVTMHYVTDAIGQLQTVHTFLYYEIAADGDGFAITKGLSCGDEVLAEGLFAVRGDFSGVFDALPSKLSHVDRPVSSQPAAGGCEVSFGKWYTTMGATYPHYADPTIALPTIEQPASDTTPGWEDWDEDGQPGVTILLSGAVAGKVFVASRTWSSAEGTVAQLGSRFQLPLAWDQEKNVIGFDGSPLLASEAVRAADPSLHFVELARLDDSQAIGDDVAICRAVMELAPTLTPVASAL